jgi:hypothetical membrane protein
LPIRSPALHLTLLAALLTLLAMGQYPGGTALDARTVGYSLDQNFLSDLGMTVAYDGRANTLGAALFLASICAMVVAFGTALWHFVKRYVAIPSSRRTAQAAAIAAIIVSVSFVGVGLTPENRVMSWHVAFTLLAFRLAPLVPCLLAIAAFRASPSARREVMGWVALTIVMIGYLLLLTFGPATSTESGLCTMVLAQKLVTIVAGGILLFQCMGAARPANQPT